MYSPVAPVGEDCGPRNGPVDGHASTRDTVGGASSLLDGQPVLPGHSSVGIIFIVVCVGVEVTPAASGCGRVLARCVLARPQSERMLGGVQANDGGRGGCGQGENSRNKGLHGD